jgi:hypothetical protein
VRGEPVGQVEPERVAAIDEMLNARPRQSRRLAEPELGFVALDDRSPQNLGDRFVGSLRAQSEGIIALCGDRFTSLTEREFSLEHENRRLGRR